MPEVPETSRGREAGSPSAGAIPFEALAEIAVGATARVDLCRVLPPHPKQGQLLAVKRLHPHIAEDPTFVNQFLDEVWMTAALRHPNVVEVAGWGTDPEGSYLAVELVQGVSLLRLMKTIFDTGEAFTERMVVYLGACLCRGLAAAHSLRAPNGELLNLVHRDLTPGNVLVGFNGEVKIADFGMAKAKQRLTKTLTGMRKGEPTYMAPEQARADEIDARADLFSFGVLLYELFAGRRPWSARSDMEMVQAVLREPPADLRELRPKIDRELVNVVSRCLEKDPAARFQSAREVGDRFDEWLLVHGYQEGNEEALARFIRRNAMRQMRWFERAISGELSAQAAPRSAAPRVPTYTEHTQRPGGPRPPPPSVSEPGPPRVAIPAPPPAPARGTTGRAPERPLVPPRAGGPVDERALRAQNVVQQLKKLAPAPEPPRGKHRRMPTLDEDNDDVTDIELRVAAVAENHPRIVDMAGDDDETGEEIPTLVQRGDADVRALQAEARKRAAQESKARPPYVSHGLIVDEDSDQRITAVKAEARRAATPGVISIVDHDSELPTEPIQSSRRRPRQLDTAETPVAPRAKPATVTKPVIPPAPNIPPQPFHAAAQAPVIPKPPTVPPPPRAQPAPPVPHAQAHPQAHAHAHAEAARAAVEPTRPPPQPPPGFAAPPAAPPAQAAYDGSRVSQHDDVQVIDRNVLRQQVLHSEEGILAEADRLSIEAVRRHEEARAAQLRAERKAAAAKLAGDAARIAGEAVQLFRTAGVAAAVKRLEEAHSLEQALATGRFAAAPGGAGTGPHTAVSLATAQAVHALGGYPAPPEAAGSDPSAVRAISTPSPAVESRSASFGVFPGVDAARAMAITGGPAPGSIPPPPPNAQPVVALQAMREMARGDKPLAPPPSRAPVSVSGPVSAPGPQSVLPAAPNAIDADLEAARLRPSILGFPSSVVVGLAVVAVFAVIVLALMLAR